MENEIVLVTKRASREHAHVLREGRRTSIEDKNSTNGTFLNGERLQGKAFLRDGDKIGVGEVNFTFHDPETTTRETPFPELDLNLTAGVQLQLGQYCDLTVAGAAPLRTDPGDQLFDSEFIVQFTRRF